MRDSRDEAFQMVEQGLVSVYDMLVMAVMHMSQNEVADMLDANELSERFREDGEKDA